MKKICTFSLLITSIIFLKFPESVAECPTIISRSQWQARQTTNQNYLVTPILYVVIHHTVTQPCQTSTSCSEIIRNIQDYHMDELNWSDIGFSFLIGGDGKIYEGVGWTREGAHTYGYNKKSIGVAFIGSYQRNNNVLTHCGRPAAHGMNKEIFQICGTFRTSSRSQNATKTMIEAARRLISCGISNSMLRPNVKVIGASQVTSTMSPGRKLLLQIQEWPEWTSIL